MLQTVSLRFPDKMRTFLYLALPLYNWNIFKNIQSVMNVPQQLCQYNALTKRDFRNNK